MQGELRYLLDMSRPPRETFDRFPNWLQPLAHGSDLEHRNDLGWTPLISASANGNLEAVNAFAKLGASLEARAVLGWTPLIVAAQSDEADVVSRLLELGARRDAVDNFGRTALSALQGGEATAIGRHQAGTRCRMPAAAFAKRRASTPFPHT
ncbi:ankyrin repeat domain-containing protein [Mesorhizobium sp. M0208]